MLKARYFPNCSVLEAEAIGDMSYTWRSILKGVELLKEGIVWRIGTGEHVRIWEDPWIPNGTTRRPRTARGSVLIDKVSDLFDPYTENWDEELVKDLFCEEDVKEILAIPLRSGMDDQPAWHLDPRGVFLVKSAYHLGTSIRDASKNRDASSLTTTPSYSKKWNRFWTLDLPPKVRMFLWRLSHNSLPLRMNVKRKQVELDTRCPICMRLDEDGGHLFLKCKLVKHLWRELHLEDVRLELPKCAGPVAMFDLLWSLTRVRRDLVLILLWEWWNIRNKANHGGKMKPTEGVAYNIRRILDDFQNGSLQTEKHDTMHTIAGWSKPKEGFVKINFDASFHVEQGGGAWGCVMRSDQGDVIAACAGRMDHLTSALQAEATACNRAIEAASEMGINQAIFKSDSLSLVNAINSGERDLSSIGVLIREARSLCYASFDAFEFTFCKRSCNSVAHSLAAFGYRAGVVCSWWKDQAPELVCDLVAGDSAVHG